MTVVGRWRYSSNVPGDAPPLWKKKIQMQRQQAKNMDNIMTPNMMSTPIFCGKTLLPACERSSHMGSYGVRGLKREFLTLLLQFT